jgi:hypothetical protein
MSVIMAGEVFSFIGAVSGAKYGELCLPAADDYDTAYALNKMHDFITSNARWADRETILVRVVFPETVELSEV